MLGAVSSVARVSVFIPVYNGESFLGAAIDSILGQTLRELEVVIVENGSSDGSRQTARRAATRDARVRIVEHARPLGIVGAGMPGSPPRRRRSSHARIRTTSPTRAALSGRSRCWSATPPRSPAGTPCDGVDERDQHIRPRDRWRLLVLPEALYRNRYHARSLTVTSEQEADESAALLSHCVEANRRGADWSDFLRASPDGAPPPRAIARTSCQPPATLPDLVVDWEDAAHNVPVRVRDSGVESTPEGLRLTGKHAYDGFLIAIGIPPAGDVIASHELHGLFTAS